ncbi:substrate-binding periplasmic protein [Pseudorhodoferax sp.]|uniref:substrate-binding periplasmic protein n=1 Tax=Pseudorhodoferax sp. TaxID=1993553 RepID=UPI002DD63039|nr:transporter substrate-binding domain-containing protein [Pseudorhodoferax sp.]
MLQTLSGPSWNRRLFLCGTALGALGGTAGAALPPSASTLAAAFVADFEPFVMGDGGILVDIVREAARRQGYGLRRLEFPSLRLDQDPLGEFPDLTMFVGTPNARRAGYHYTPVYAFDNVAATLSDSRLQIASLQDLAGKSIVAFNNASLHLKEPFTSFHRKELAGAKGYLEIERMESIVAMLLNQRAQVALLDRTFLRYYARKLGRPNLAGITVHDLFPEKNEIYAVSKNAELIAALGRQIQQMQASGWTAEMLKKYL